MLFEKNDRPSLVYSGCSSNASNKFCQHIKPSICVNPKKLKTLLVFEPNETLADVLTLKIGISDKKGCK
jgi:hypothetical protein